MGSSRQVIPETLEFADDGAIPNHPRFPALLYRGVDEAANGPASSAERTRKAKLVWPDACEALFARNGWEPRWRAGVYPFHHFHSTAHEALGVVSGTATLRLGGPGGQDVQLRAGDVVVLPAGTGHKRESGDPDFLVVGAYPPGQAWDLRRGDPAEHDEVVANIERVPDPESDPVGGPLTELWT
jgi:uncharacterized protein YjlB